MRRFLHWFSVASLIVLAASAIAEQKTPPPPGQTTALPTAFGALKLGSAPPRDLIPIKTQHALHVRVPLRYFERRAEPKKFMGLATGGAEYAYSATKLRGILIYFPPASARQLRPLLESKWGPPIVALNGTLVWFMPDGSVIVYLNESDNDNASGARVDILDGSLILHQ